MDAPVNPNLRSSVLWSSVRNWGTRLGSVAVFFAVARILPPAELGLFASAAVIIAFADIFAENGIGDAIVQRKKINPELLSTALWMNLAIAALICLVLWLAAENIAQYLRIPGLATVLPPVAFGVVLNAISFVPQGLLRREFKFRALGIRALWTTGLSGVTGVALALAGFGVWSLVAQFLLAGLFNAGLIWRCTSWRPRLLVRIADARSIGAFGMKIFLGKLLSLSATRIIELIIAASLGPAMLAIYVMGTRINAVLMQMLSGVTIDVSLSNFSRLANSEYFEQSFYRTMKFAAMIMVPAFVMLSALAPEVTWIAFGKNGAGSAIILSFVALLSSIECVQFLCGTVLIAKGRPDISTFILVIKTISVLVVLTIFDYQAIDQMVLAYVVTMVCVSPLSFYFAARIGRLSLAKISSIYIPVFASSSVSYVIILFLRPYISEITPNIFIRLVALTAIGAISYLACAAMLDYRGLKTTITLLRGTIRGASNATES